MLSFESTYESNRTYPRIRIINYPADIACGEKHDPETGTAESGSKGENASKNVVQRVSGRFVSFFGLSKPRFREQVG